MSRSRANKKKRDDLYGILLITFAIMVFVAGFFFFIDVSKNQVLRDEKDNCRIDGFIAKESVLLVDTTDSVNPTQYQAIKNKLELILDNSIVDERVTVYTITEDPTKISPLIVTCNPGDGADRSEWTSNKRRLKLNWDKKFKEKLESAVTGILEAELTKQSPILDAIKAVGVYSFSSSKAEFKQLVIVSDLLHHTAELSHYRQPKLTYSSVENSPYMGSVLANLNGAEIEILYLTRQKDYIRQGRTHLLFWEKYFEKSNAVVIKISNVN
ncbi:hypothetical protein [Shewanella sp. SM32]|uniref:hypothetical protein n=1 Tax=Shewanella sp. SM32 TaxID=2912796 RepID=UPI0021D9AC98|nr:hypothetical protein [Shewanella sp. SM32]MCU8071005.1 hypothetical protein [Shewanella sp. SM32]